MIRSRRWIFKGIVLLSLILAFAIQDPVRFLKINSEAVVKAEQIPENPEECRDKYLGKISKIYKHYNKIFYTAKAYKKLTAYYDDGVTAINACGSTEEIKRVYADYKKKISSVTPSKLIKYQKKLEKKLNEAYDSLIGSNEFSQKGLSKMESLKEKGLESIYGSQNKRRSRNALSAAIQELTVFAKSEEAGRDVIAELEEVRKKLINNAGYYNSLSDINDETWCFKRMADHSPSIPYETFGIADYDGFYINKNVKEGDKVIYLTFDCGYPSKLTEKILDTLKKHNAKASFFVTKMYLEKCGDYAKRMVEEGHAVCNHTVTHTDLRKKSIEKIAAEIIDVAEYFYEITGTEFAPFFRTPTGAYTKRLLTIIKDAGYKTVFWSIAYGDYDQNNQPAAGYVTNHFKTYHHNGAIALMHNDSTSNANELDAVLTLLEKEGYRFGALSEIE